MSYTKEDVRKYHSQPRPGKLEVMTTKPASTQDDLTLAYSPGVADACRDIQDDAAWADTLTGRSNLVAVVTNGTAVLGLGNIGPLAGKPVMEGKCMLFKRFADVDAFDLELDCSDPDRLIDIVKSFEPTFGGINLEDIKGPDCFYIEEELKKAMNIPVFHDDQHGTAVITGAAMLNAARITGCPVEEMKVVVLGIGAAGMACAKFYAALGVRPENISMFNRKGLVHKGRTDLNPVQMTFAQPQPEEELAPAEALAKALKSANLLLGLSGPGMLKAEMIKEMAPSPVIFACANPVPEIGYAEAKAVRPDAIMGTGRSDFPNQVNNVAGFPFIFRGALDVRASKINEEMKIAAAQALAELAQQPVPDSVKAAYKGRDFEFGAEYVIPTPFDPRIIEWVSPAVAQAALDTGVARGTLEDIGGSLDAYRARLRARMEAAGKRCTSHCAMYE
ncbi:MAG: malate dehydrogenase [Mailhella sp.]|nr:malate dehydrogenase [Mailhella sp.]